MRRSALIFAASAISIVLAAGPTAAGQDPQEPGSSKPEPVFVRLSVYPTASLSRYDYNNDIDLYEVRTYVELRRGSQEGPPLTGAEVTVWAEKLDYVQDHYERRTVLDKGRLPAEIEVRIAYPGRPAIKERFPIPDWLVLTDPKPAILDPAEDLILRWQYGRFLAPVDISAYDFRSGKALFQKDNQAGPTAVIPAASLPPSTIIRIYVIQSWLYKRFLSGEAYARGSEVNVIPWSQVFVRTK
jgi:hypothetical protein